MFEVTAVGRYDIPGRGVIFTANNRYHGFDLKKLVGHEVKIRYSNSVGKWKVTNVECFEHCEVIGLNVTKCK